MDYTSTFLAFEHFRIHYLAGGEGIPVVLLHGYGEDGNIWKHVDGAFEGFRVIIPDFPGFGKSEVAAAFTLEEMMRVFLHLIDQEGIDRFYVFGHSMGGYTVSEFVSAVPERLLGAGMIHSHPFGDTAEIRANRKKREDHIANHGSEAFVKAFYPLLFGTDYAANNPDVVDEMRTYGASLDPQAFIAGMRAMRIRPDRSEGFRAFPRPVLFLVGDDDRAVPSDLSMKQLSLPSTADVHILEGVGHTSMLEAPGEFIQIVKSYLAMSQALENEE